MAKFQASLRRGYLNHDSEREVGVLQVEERRVETRSVDDHGAWGEGDLGSLKVNGD